MLQVGEFRVLKTHQHKKKPLQGKFKGKKKRKRLKKKSHSTINITVASSIPFLKIIFPHFPLTSQFPERVRQGRGREGESVLESTSFSFWVFAMVGKARSNLQVFILRDNPSKGKAILLNRKVFNFINKNAVSNMFVFKRSWFTGHGVQWQNTCPGVHEVLSSIPSTKTKSQLHSVGVQVRNKLFPDFDSQHWCQQEMLKCSRRGKEELFNISKMLEIL